MVYAIRAHSNGVEQVPIFALVVLALTLLQASRALLAVLVIVFTAARLFHAYGMIFKSFLSRRIGAATTYMVQLIGIVAMAYQILV